MALGRIERLYFDNIWANTGNPSLPCITIGFADYLYNKNIKNKLAKPVIRPQSLDTYLESKLTVEIMTQQVQDLER